MLQFVTKMIIKFITKMETLLREQEMLCYARKIGLNRTVPGKPRQMVTLVLMSGEDTKKWMSMRGSWVSLSE